MRIIFVFLTSILALTLTGIGFFWVGFLNSTGDSKDTSEVVFEVKKGESFHAVTQRLKEAGLISSARGFLLYARLTKMDQATKVGEYSLFKNLKPRDILERLASGKSRLRKFTIPEGLNIYEIANKFESEGFGNSKNFLDLCFDKEFIKKILGEGDFISLEGYLLPETYSLTKYTDAAVLIETAVGLFKDNFQKLQSKYKSIELKPHEIVTLASIIEKETGNPEERPLIGSVFYNRLKKNMLLQTDPTVIYGIADETGSIITNIRKDDLRRVTRFNTYTNKGLPPGPIANPGLKALEAAMNPALSKMLFFVSRKDGSHYFSETYSEHRKAVEKFQLSKETN